MSYKEIHFETMGEIIDYVFEGNVLFYQGPNGKPMGKLTTDASGLLIIRADDLEDSPYKVHKNVELSYLIKAEWYENIPERGVLGEYKGEIYLFHKLLGDHLTDRRENFKIHKDYARPLTNDEIKLYFRG